MNNLDSYNNFNKKNQKDKVLEISKNISDNLRCDVGGNCVHFAELLVLELEKNNPELLDTFKIIEGWVESSIGEGIDQGHTWIEFEDGEKLDPTFIQFGDDAEYLYPDNVYTGSEYLDLVKSDDSYIKKREMHPERIFKNIDNG